MDERDKTRLRDMLDAALKARSFIQNKTRDMLDEDEMLTLALVRAIEIVGEAANQVTKETQNNYPQIPWKVIIGMRNKLIHDYVNIDHNVLWDTVTHDLPALITELEKVIPSE
ncbi:MAG: DUF86 domain-containing protein [Anaerolineae bacterium]|nr:DUF86 domain-containing protein [Anaerolineae bacterium]